MEREEKDKANEERRFARAKQVMSDPDDRAHYGYSDKVVEYMRLSVGSYRGSLKIE